VRHQRPAARADCGAIEIRDTTTLITAEGVRLKNPVINTTNSLGVRRRTTYSSFRMARRYIPA